MRRMVLNRKTVMTHLCFGSPHKISTLKIFIQMIKWSKLIGFKCCLLQATDDYCCVNNAGNCVYSLKYLVSLCCFAVVWRNYKSGILNTLSLFGRWQGRGRGLIKLVTKSNKGEERVQKWVIFWWRPFWIAHCVVMFLPQ